MQSFEDHDCVAQVGGGCGVLAVGEAGPVDVFVVEGGCVRGCLFGDDVECRCLPEVD